ncbi:DUF1648 domain-containing protein [Blastococcus sp. LR1]|uniref:DUF1648 domain-containing protein n=1 Tax=Blastococcus sp. LR1 TaxID=2877000 RepID=UPI001CD03B86|nr:DUF1648 domain-containing protein [Blastococcus sp. LR1]MCA0144665.1 DUF1648 domain-containing protein [Blastococcus sp. LR1]
MGRARMGFVGAGVLFAAVWLWSLGRLPERVPTHFGGSGEADAWSSRAVALGTFGVIGLGTAALFAGLVWFVGRVPAEHVNVPHPEYWKQPEHLDRLRRLLAEDMWWLGASTLLLLAAVQLLLVRAAALEEPRLGPWAVVALGTYLLVLGGRLAWMFTRRYAVPGRA